MNTVKEYDLLSWSQDKDIKKIINGEKILYSDFIYKISLFGLNNERIILLTDKSIYYMKGKSLIRKIQYSEIIGITMSKTSDEFILHLNIDDQDFNFTSKNKNLLISKICKLYQNNTKKILKLCEVDKNMKQYITSKKDKKQSKSATKMDTKLLIDTKKFIQERSKVNAKQLEKEKISKKRKVGTIFSTHQTIKHVGVNDFKLIKVIGRGSYGKVCLVQFKKTNDLYAMKSLKKDVLLDEDQVESTLLEKDILQSINYPFLVGMVFCFQTEERVYFVLPFIQGGELFKHLRQNKYFSEDKVKF